MKILFAVYDNEGDHNLMPLGVLYVAAYLRKHGYTDIHFYNQDVYRYSEAHLKEYLSKNKFDIIGLGFVAGYFQHHKIQALCKAINKATYRPFMVLGGHGPTPVPEFYLRITGADAVVMGEGEIPFLNLVKALENHDSLSDIKGIAYREGNEIRINEREKPIKNLEEIPFPYVEGIPLEYYVNAKPPLKLKPTDRLISMITGRGCNYSCNFCLRLEKGIRLRPIEAVIEEIKKYIRDYNISYMIFWDELFMVSEKRIAEFSEAILRENIKINYWCTGRLNIVNDNILKLMKRSGCVYIDFGIEQFDNHALKAMNKKQTEDQIVHGIEMTQQAGISVAFNIIFGNVGDTRESLKKSLNLLKKYNDYGQLRVIRPVTPYPGSPLYYEAIARGLLKGPEDFYEKHQNLERLTVNFTDIPDAEFYRLMFEANQEIIEDYFNYTKNNLIERFRNVYQGVDVCFRGARHT
jgi:anaerobic magnesium-protoporphyrin IX monomethyl ester cyclase